jgi:hypothetical protein
MTYKHADDFFTSPTMREFIRIASQNDALKSSLPAVFEPVIEKTASAKEDPKTFAENLLLLCEELRSEGFTSYAHTLEQKFLLFKQASMEKTAEKHLYNVHDETGANLIEFAHPGGGNKELDKSWDELGEVETVSEKQKKIIDVLNKVPTAKSVKQAAPNVAAIAKIILAQAPHLSKEQLQEIAIAKWKQITGLVHRAYDMAERHGGVSWWAGRGISYSGVKDAIAKTLAASPTLQRVKELSVYINQLRSVLGSWTNNEDVQNAHRVLDNIDGGPDHDGMVNLLADVKRAIGQIEDLEVSDAGHMTDTGIDATTQAPPHTTPAAQEMTAVIKACNDNITQALPLLPEAKEYAAKFSADPGKLARLKTIANAIQTFLNDMGTISNQVAQGKTVMQAANETASAKGTKDLGELVRDAGQFIQQVTSILQSMRGA